MPNFQDVTSATFKRIPWQERILNSLISKPNSWMILSAFGSWKRIDIQHWEESRLDYKYSNENVKFRIYGWWKSLEMAQGKATSSNERVPWKVDLISLQFEKIKQKQITNVVQSNIILNKTTKNERKS